MQIVTTETADLDQIFKFFDDSINYQEKNGFPAWRNYDKGAIIRDIENKNQYKIVADGKTAIVFSVCYRDKVIWRTRDTGSSIYLHRIVVNPEFKGQRLFGTVLEWAIDHTHQKKLSSIRMDTWASNPAIIEYYKTFGFEFVEFYTTPDTTELPLHNRNLGLALLEFKNELNGLSRKQEFTQTWVAPNKFFTVTLHRPNFIVMNLNATFILRVAISIVLVMHSIPGMFNNGINNFGNLYLNEVGFAPFGVLLAWMIKLSHIAAAVCFLTNKFIKPAAVVTIFIMIMGMIMVHWPEGWYVVGGGRNGIEFNFLIIAILVTLMFPRGFAKSSQPDKSPQH